MTPHFSYRTFALTTFARVVCQNHTAAISVRESTR